MHTEPLKKWVVNAIDEMKGQNIRVLDVAQLTPMADSFVIVTGNSSRHVSALAERIHELARTQSLHCQIEGRPGSEWILVDLGNVIVHVMTQDMREYYCLEKLWVNMTPEILEAAVA